MTKNSYLQHDASEKNFVYRIQGWQQFFCLKVVSNFHLELFFEQLFQTIATPSGSGTLRTKNIHLGRIDLGLQCLKQFQSLRRNSSTVFCRSNEECQMFEPWRTIRDSKRLQRTLRYSIFVVGAFWNSWSFYHTKWNCTGCQQKNAPPPHLPLLLHFLWDF